MKFSKYGKELDLLLLLTDNGSYTVKQLAQKLGVTERTIYYYLEYLHFSGFILIKQGGRYRIDRSSPFFRRLREQIVLNESEAEYVCKMLEDAAQTNHIARSVRAKLEQHFRLEERSNPEVLRRLNANLQQLKAAMAAKKMAVLKNYSSPHSKTIADRIVEPFRLMHDNMDVRCYELRSHANKTFRIARAESIEMIDVPWIHEDDHRQEFVDIFMFSGEERLPVSLRLGQLAYNLMLEEYPASQPYISPDGDNSWVLNIDVASYLGIGRFVMGLYDDVEVLGDKAFAEYIRQKVQAMKEKPVR